MKEFFNHLLGEGFSAALFFAYFIWGVLGVAISLYFDFTSSGAKHKTFDPKYFFTDNLWRIIGSVIALFLVIIFGEELGFPISTNFGMLMMGFNADKIIETIKDRKKRKDQVKQFDQ